MSKSVSKIMRNWRRVTYFYRDLYYFAKSLLSEEDQKKCDAFVQRTVQNLHKAEE